MSVARVPKDAPRAPRGWPCFVTRVTQSGRRTLLVGREDAQAPQPRVRRRVRLLYVGRTCEVEGSQHTRSLSDVDLGSARSAVTDADTERGAHGDARRTPGRGRRPDAAGRVVLAARGRGHRAQRSFRGREVGPLAVRLVVRGLARSPTRGPCASGMVGDRRTGGGVMDVHHLADLVAPTAGPGP